MWRDFQIVAALSSPWLFFLFPLFENGHDYIVAVCASIETIQKYINSGEQVKPFHQVILLAFQRFVSK